MTRILQSVSCHDSSSRHSPRNKFQHVDYLQDGIQQVQCIIQDKRWLCKFFRYICISSLLPCLPLASVLSVCLCVFVCMFTCLCVCVCSCTHLLPHESLPHPTLPLQTQFLISRYLCIRRNMNYCQTIRYPVRFYVVLFSMVLSVRWKFLLLP